MVVRPGGGDGPGAIRAQTVGDDELSLADRRPAARREPAEIEFARRWRDMPKVVFSSTTSTVDWNTRLVTGNAVTEITRLRPRTAIPWTSAAPHSPQRPCGPG